MAGIKVKLSSIELYTNQCRDEYNLILNIANDILSRSEKMHNWMQDELEKIDRQVVRAEMARDEISDKVNLYVDMMEDAKDDYDRYTDEINDIRNNPITITTTDDEGNEKTEEVIDYEALCKAERARDEAYSTYHYYRDKKDEAKLVLYEAKELERKFQGVQRVMNNISQDMLVNICEIKKFIKAVEEETEHNIYSLQEVVNSLQYYLSSKVIFMPEGSYYEEFAPANISNSFSDNMATSNNDGRLSENKEQENTDISSEKTYNEVIGLEKTNQDYTYVTLEDGSVEKIFDHPEESVRYATIDQSGTNVIVDGKKYSGICALCDLTTLLNRAGVQVSVNEVVRYAVNNGLCETYESIEKNRAPQVQALLNKLNNTTNPAIQEELKIQIVSLMTISSSIVGGTTPANVKKIAKHFGLEAETISKTFMGHRASFLNKPMLNSLATCVENGKGVYISVMAGGEKYNPNGWYGSKIGAHALVLNSVVRDAKTNEIKAFYLIDSNGENPQEASVRVSIKDLSSYFYTRAFVTKNIIW